VGASGVIGYLGRRHLAKIISKLKKKFLTSNYGFPQSNA
jgi:hypothetical protein